MEHEELEKEFGSSGEVDSKKEKIDVSSSPLSPLLGPEDFHHPSFLNSMVSCSCYSFFEPNPNSTFYERNFFIPSKVQAIRMRK